MKESQFFDLDQNECEIIVKKLVTNKHQTSNWNFSVVVGAAGDLVLEADDSTDDIASRDWDLGASLFAAADWLPFGLADDGVGVTVCGVAVGELTSCGSSVNGM